MTKSFSLKIDPRRRAYARLIGDIEQRLNEALAEEAETRGLTKARIAAVLGKNKAFVTRKLVGTGNMTIETLSDLAYAMDRRVEISLPREEARSGTNEPTTRSGAVKAQSGGVINRLPHNSISTTQA